MIFFLCIYSLIATVAIFALALLLWVASMQLQDAKAEIEYRDRRDRGPLASSKAKVGSLRVGGAS